MNSLAQVRKHQFWWLWNTQNEERVATPVQKFVLCGIHLPCPGGHLTIENQVESLFHREGTDLDLVLYAQVLALSIASFMKDNPVCKLGSPNLQSFALSVSLASLQNRKCPTH